MTDTYIPKCEDCKHIKNCSVRKSLKEARETIFNIGREMAGRKDFIFQGEIIREEAQDNG